MKKMELSLVEELGVRAEKAATTVKVKKWGVVPPRRRSIKRLMFDKFVESIGSVFRACCHPDRSGSASTSLQKNCGSLERELLKIMPTRKTKNMRIFPRKDHLLAIPVQNDPSPS